ncbi:hypothetical protein J421_4389 [Gemmatirosa kalamazoonensis]|uniref:Outer membrane protein beta-barrel domain-containing protein n=1 Tax=Gemmatirosa kalamazoonensis TaxID=861299 RepID=W0RMD4_9BACT|nr:hypothetical protein [Gemmatirosa kalamazoonensis]AHG91926.1 hypothetical protein J421_4389 [Gemmatirosa kalamazoonensis]
MLRFTTSRAMGFAVALTLGAVATASAQQDTTRSAPRRSRSQLPIRKEQPATPSTETTPSSSSSSSTSSSTYTMPARDTVLVGRSDTTVVMCNCATTQSASTGEVLPLIPARIQRFFGNGLSLGLAAGSVHPVGDAMQSYNPGWGINVPLTWDPPHSPLGARLVAAYTEFNSASSVGVADATQWSLGGDLKFRVPFGRFLKATSGAYLVGGGAVHHFTNYNRSIFLTNNLYNTKYSSPALNAQVAAAAQSQSSSNTSLGTHAGLGLSLGVGPAELFGEARYTRVYTPGKAVNYIPIMAGVSFH